MYLTTQVNCKGAHKKYFSQYTSKVCFSSSSNRSKWVPKNAEFYADSKSEEKIVSKCTDEKIFKKNLAKKQFIEYNFFVVCFYNFCLQICNQRKILRFFEPILINLKKKGFLFCFMTKILLVWPLRLATPQHLSNHLGTQSEVYHTPWSRRSAV